MLTYLGVHHLLDAPSDDESEAGDEPVLSSGANGSANPWLMGMGSQPGVQIAPNSPMPMWELEISEDEAMKSDDEDYGRGAGRNREDDYDEEDDFIAASDEEPEIVEDDDDPDEGIMASPKRKSGGNDDDDEDETVPSNRTKRRRVVDDDEDDE